MPTVKQVAVYNGSQWSEFHDIGAKATNVTLSNNSDQLLESNNVQGILKNLIGTNRSKLTGGEIVTTTLGGALTTSGIKASALSNLNNVVVLDSGDAAPTTGETSEIKKLKQGNTIIYPTSKTSAIYMPDNTTLDGYLDNISDSIGNTDISEIGGGTITGALSSLNDIVNNINNNIGIVYSAAAKTISLTGGDTNYKAGSQLTVPAGSYIILANGSYNGNSTLSTRRIQIAERLSNGTINPLVTQGSYAAWWTQQQCIFVTTADAERTFLVQLSCSVSITNAVTNMRFIKIR